jgi:glycosyltransferase involved in cell wall biosynthesis
VKILFVCSSTNGSIVPFIKDQQLMLINEGHSVDCFTINSKGYFGYLKSIFELREFLRKNKYDLIHAHYGLSGLVATFQNKTPVVVTYHGSDIHQKKVYKFSKIAIKRANHNIFVSKKLKGIAGHPKSSTIIPCGVEFTVFKKMNKNKLREKLGLNPDKKYVLFSSNFDRQIKNPEIAIKAVSAIKNTELLELKGFSREQVAQLMNAVDICLLVSQDEGSPQFIKEAAACGQWIVTTDVGDVQEILYEYPKVKYVTQEIDEVKNTIKNVLKKKEEIHLKNFDLSKYDNKVIVKELIEVYKSVLSEYRTTIQ